MFSNKKVILRATLSFIIPLQHHRANSPPNNLATRKESDNINKMQH